MTRHIKYPEEVRMEAIGRMERIAKNQDRLFLESLQYENKFEQELRLLVDEFTRKITIATGIAHVS